MVALLETLKNALRDFAAREEKLNADFRTRSAVETRAFDTAKGAQSATAAETIAKATADFDATSSRLNTGFEQRKARLNQAHINARKRVLDAITQQEADIKYSVQTGSLEAERVRDEKLTATGRRLRRLQPPRRRKPESLRGIGSSGAQRLRRLRPLSQIPRPRPRMAAARFVRRRKPTARRAEPVGEKSRR